MTLNDILIGFPLVDSLMFEVIRWISPVNWNDLIGSQAIAFIKPQNDINLNIF